MKTSFSIYPLYMRFPVLFFFIAAGIGSSQPAVPLLVRPFAGIVRNIGDNGPAPSALLSSPHHVSVDRGGTLYIADSAENLVRRVTPDGVISTLDSNVQFPWSAVAGPAGDIYVADTANHRIKRISPSGSVSIVAGNGAQGYSGDGGAATAAQLNFPRAVAVDGSGNLYIADTANNRIRIVRADGRISTYAGTGILGAPRDGENAAESPLGYPSGIAVDSARNLYIAEALGQHIRIVTPDGVIHSVAGSDQAGAGAEGVPALGSPLNTPDDVAVDGQGNVYIADTNNNRVRKIKPDGTISTLAGTGVAGFRGDNGPASAAQLNAPKGVASDMSGNVFIADSENHRIRKVAPNGIITTVAGSDPGSGDGGPALAARLFAPGGIAVDASGNVFIADTNNHRVRRVGTDGTITTVAGTGSPGYSDNGSGQLAQLNAPVGLAFDRSGNLYIADSGNHAIRKLSQGFLTTVAGTGVLGNSGDEGPATKAQLFNPNAIAFDASGAMYIADSSNNRIRRVTADGIIHNLAGEAKQGLPGLEGDGEIGDNAKFSYPSALAVDSDGSVYVADRFNDRIRRIDPVTRRVSTVAGTDRGFGGDNGPATQAHLSLPTGIAFDSTHNLYITDYGNNRIRVVGRNGTIQTIAGAGKPGDAGDNGPALAALLNSPWHLAIGVQGIIYFSDQDNSRVRQLVPATASIRSIVNAASSLAGAIAPGEIVTIYGAQLGPAAGISAQGADGMLASSLAGTRVLFDEIPAPLIYASGLQISAIVPYSVAGRNTSQIVIEVNGVRSAPFTAIIREAAPGLFTATGVGSGPGAVQNQDGSFNTPANPAQRGSVVVFYATGEGQTNPPGVAGAIPNAALPSPQLGVTVQIGGRPAEVLYAGAAPGIAGLLQVNVRVPLEAPAGTAVPLSLTVGNFAAQPGVTISLR